MAEVGRDLVTSRVQLALKGHTEQWAQELVHVAFEYCLFGHVDALISYVQLNGHQDPWERPARTHRLVILHWRQCFFACEDEQCWNLLCGRQNPLEPGDYSSSGRRRHCVEAGHCTRSSFKLFRVFGCAALISYSCSALIADCFYL